MFQHLVAPAYGLAAFDRLAIAKNWARRQIALAIGEGLVKLHRLCLACSTHELLTYVLNPRESQTFCKVGKCGVPMLNGLSLPRSNAAMHRNTPTESTT